MDDVLRVVVVALVAASCSSSQSSRPSAAPAPQPLVAPGSPAPAPLPFTSECVKPEDPSLAELRTRADAATKQGFESELARNRLRVIEVAAHYDELAQGLSYVTRSAREGTAIKKQLDGKKGTYVAAETFWSGNAGSPAPWLFVQNERGDVFRLIRKPRAGVTRVTLCGCRPQECGPYGSGCPACGSTSQIMYGPLPSGTPYKGQLELAYPASFVWTDYDPKASCPAPRACPPPPP